MKTGHETRDVDVPSVITVTLILFIAGALIFLCVWILLHWLQLKRSTTQRPSVLAVSAGAFPQPRLETRPGMTLEAVRANEEKRINSYGWIDRDAGLAHIPIERAMQLLLQRGLPDVGANQTPLQFMQAAPNEPPQ